MENKNHNSANSQSTSPGVLCIQWMAPGFPTFCLAVLPSLDFCRLRQHYTKFVLINISLSLWSTVAVHFSKVWKLLGSSPDHAGQILCHFITIFSGLVIVSLHWSAAS